MELLSPEGLRLDGHRLMEMGTPLRLAPFPMQIGPLFFQMGNIKVIVRLYGPREMQTGSQQVSDQTPCAMNAEWLIQ